MASIPLVALSVKNPEAPDLLQNYARVAALKNQQQESAYRQQQMQQAQQEAPLRLQALQQATARGEIEGQQAKLAFDQAQQDAEDQKRITAAMTNWDGKNPDDLISGLKTNGVSAKGIFGTQKTLLEGKAKAAEIAKNDSVTGKNHADTLIANGNAIGGALAPLVDPKTVPDAQLPQAVMQTAQDLASKGLLDPAHLQQVQQIANSGDPAAIRQQVDMFRKTNMTQTQLLEQAKAEETARHNQQVETETGRHNLREEGLSGARLAVERQNADTNRQRLGFETGTSKEGGDIIDAIGTGKIGLDRMGQLLSRNPGLVDQVVTRYPDFDTSKVGGYVKAVKDFTSTSPSSAGGMLNAGGTALGHLKELKELNTPASLIPGTAAHAAYENKVETLATELAKFYGDSTVSGISALKGTLNSKLPWQREAAINTQAQSMGSKFDSLEQSWQNAAPSKAYQQPMPGLSPKAIEARESLDPSFKARREQEQKAAAPAAKEGDTKMNSHGDKLVFKGGAWQLQG